MLNQINFIIIRISVLKKSFFISSFNFSSLHNFCTIQGKNKQFGDREQTKLDFWRSVCLGQLNVGVCFKEKTSLLISLNLNPANPWIYRKLSMIVVIEYIGETKFIWDNLETHRIFPTSLSSLGFGLSLCVQGFP